MAQANTSNAVTSAEILSGARKPPRIVYEAGGGRKTFFSFAFLILLPFFVSLPAMLYSRLTHGLWIDTIGLAVFAGAFTVVMFLLLVELMTSLRTRAVLGEEAARMTLPSGRGPTPMLRYMTHEIPYDEVQSVETRREVYGGRLAPVILKGAQVAMKNGDMIKLGYVSEANVDPAFPYPEIAKQIADRARLPLIDRGNVRRSVRRKFLGLKATGIAGRPDDNIVDDAEIEVLNRSHNNFMLALVSALAVLLLLGIAFDIASNDPVGLAGGTFLGTFGASTP